MKKKAGIIIFSLFMGVNIHAQELTYDHDDIKMNQISVMESGYGSLDNLYYTAFHRSYKQDAYKYGKAETRTLAMLEEKLQVAMADSIKSDLEKRAKVEAVNLIDRNIDAVWVFEKDRITEALKRLRSNIETLKLFCSDAEERKYWTDTYNGIDWSINAMKKGYMPNSEREKEFTALLEDINKTNVLVAKRCIQLYTAMKTKLPTPKKRPPLRSKEEIVMMAQNNWVTAAATK